MSYKIIHETTLPGIVKTFDEGHCNVLDAMATEIVECLKRGNKLLLCGNGGSAADCQHIAAEFVGRFKKERRGYPAISLTTDTSIITAVGNDYGYEMVFSRQVEALGCEGDILIGISTSGKSLNVFKAVIKAKEMGMRTFVFTGNGGGPLRDIIDVCFNAESNDTPSIQAAHIIALHTMCESVENMLTA